MAERDFTVIDDGRVCDLRGRVGAGRVRLSPASVKAALGWELRPEGLCKDDQCVPVRDRSALANDDGIDLEAFAATLGRPLAVDGEEGVAYLGVPAARRAASIASLEAPDFTLPDLDGTLHSLSDYRGKKVLLVAYASW